MSYSGVHFLNLTKTYKNKLVSHVFETLNCKCIISFMKLYFILTKIEFFVFIYRQEQNNENLK